MDDIDDKRLELEHKLNVLFVDSYNTLMEAVKLINKALEAMNIDYEYTYDQFCIDFANEMYEYQNKNRDCDMTDVNNIIIYTGFIIVSMINKIKDKTYNEN